MASTPEEDSENFPLASPFASVDWRNASVLDYFVTGTVDSIIDLGNSKRSTRPSNVSISSAIPKGNGNCFESMLIVNRGKFERQEG